MQQRLLGPGAHATTQYAPSLREVIQERIGLSSCHRAAQSGEAQAVVKGVGFGEMGVRSGCTACVQKPCHRWGPRFLSDIAETTIRTSRWERSVPSRAAAGHRGADKVGWWPPRAAAQPRLLPGGKPRKLTAVSIPNSAWLSHDAAPVRTTGPGHTVGQWSKDQDQRKEKRPRKLSSGSGVQQAQDARGWGCICTLTP